MGSGWASPALREQGPAITATGALRRERAGPFRIGLRVPPHWDELGAVLPRFLRRGLLCGHRHPVADPHRATPTLETEWRPLRKLALSVGGGYGPGLIERVPDRADPRAHTEPGHSDLEPSAVAFAACELGASRPCRLEVAWRLLGRIDIWSPVHPTRITTVEAALHLTLGGRAP